MKKGFTLIELLVVIAIIGILSGLIAIGMSKAIDSANDAKRRNNIDTIRTGLVIYGTLNKGLFPIQTVQCNIGSNCPNLTTALLELLPVSPKDPDGTFYKYISDGTSFTVSSTLSSSDTFSYNSESGYNTDYFCGYTVPYDGVDYDTVKIGSQCWFKENLNVGTMTAGVNEQGTDCSAIQKYCYNNDEAYCSSDGGLYQWDQAMCGSSVAGVQGVCPTGWHLPTDADYKKLEIYLGMPPAEAEYGGWFRGTNQASQLSLYTLNGNDSTGFSALIVGYRHDTDGSFRNHGTNMYLWTSSMIASLPLKRSMRPGTATVFRSTNVKNTGFSIRCIKN